MAWLVTTGHVVAFTNGDNTAVEKFPKYGPQWKRRKDKADVSAPEKPAAGASAPAPEAEQPPAAEAPAPEPVAEASESAPAQEPSVVEEPLPVQVPAAKESVEEKQGEEKNDETAAVVAE